MNSSRPMVRSQHLRSPDTDEEGHRVQMEVLRRIGGSQRLEIAMRMVDDARAVTAAGIASRHAEYSPPQIRWALFRMLLGDTLFQAAWPDAPLLEP